MDCSHIQNNLIEFIDDQLTDDDNKIFVDHIGSCAECNAQFNYLKETYGLIEAEKEMPINPFFYAKVKLRLENQLEPKRNKNMWVRWLKPVGIAASIVVGFYIGNGEVNIESEIVEEMEIADEILFPADYEDLLITYNE